jgi:hypothetical protein
MIKIEDKSKNERLLRLEKAIMYLRGTGKIKRDNEIISKIGYGKSSLSNILNGNKNVSEKFTKKFCDTFNEIDFSWLLTGSGEMLKNAGSVKFYDPKDAPPGKKLIPFYDDAVTVGGNLPERAASTESNSQPTEWIDPGDWFKNATAALRHYGDSMIEYPTGCILALKEVQDRRLIVPGKDYVIETGEYRVTKKIQLCDNPEYIRAYSTNEEKYDDGTLIHQPFNIPLSLINRIFEVLGYVVKKGNGTMVFSNQK